MAEGGQHVRPKRPGFTLGGGPPRGGGLGPCRRRQMSAAVASRAPVFLLDGTQRGATAFSDLGQQSSESLPKAAVHLFTGGCVPCTSDHPRVTHKPASQDPGRGGGHLHHSAVARKKEGPMSKQSPGPNSCLWALGMKKVSFQAEMGNRAPPTAAPVSCCSRKSAEPRELSKCHGLFGRRVPGDQLIRWPPPLVLQDDSGTRQAGGSPPPRSRSTEKLRALSPEWPSR